MDNSTITWVCSPLYIWAMTSFLSYLLLIFFCDKKITISIWISLPYLIKTPTFLDYKQKIKTVLTRPTEFRLARLVSTSMYLYHKHSVIQCFYTLLEIRMTLFFVQGSSISKSKTNGDYYQKSDYRRLRINTLFLICWYAMSKGIYKFKCLSVSKTVTCCSSLSHSSIL